MKKITVLSILIVVAAFFVFTDTCVAEKVQLATGTYETDCPQEVDTICKGNFNVVKFVGGNASENILIQFDGVIFDKLEFVNDEGGDLIWTFVNLSKFSQVITQVSCEKDECLPKIKGIIGELVELDKFKELRLKP